MFYFLVNAAYAATKETTSFNTFELIFHSSFVVQLILLLLAFFSFTSWAIMFAKWGVFKRSFRSTDKFLDIFWSGKSLDSIYSESKKFKTSSIAKLFQAGYIELQRILEKEKQNSPEGKVKDANSALLNLERSLKRASRNESIRLEKWLSFLATAGSTAPFIGLFGTVWGIMNAFQSIGMQGAANLATVAPGIAEALITTAVGLFCAIPAVMGYNFFVGKLKKMFFHMENFSGDFLNIVKRNFLT